MLHNCQSLLQSLGWHCHDLEGASYVVSPLSLGGTRPLDCYVKTIGDQMRITDDGGVLWSLQQLGYPVDDGKASRPLRSLALTYHIGLDDYGAFYSEAPAKQAQQHFARWLQFFSALSSWEAERVSTLDHDLEFADKVQKILARYEKRPLIEAPRIEVGETVYTFDFQWGDLLIDAIPANANATNSRLRKALMVHRLDDEIPMLFVVDDEKSMKRADQEVVVLANVAPAMAFRRFEEYVLQA